jgi:transcriptional regulator with XRE-family HTH domain
MATKHETRSVNGIDHKLGQRVRARRMEIGMSQERLAELLGVTFQQVQKYEKGVNRIAASRLHDIALALDMPVARFFENLSGRPSSAGSGANATSVMATPEGQELMALFGSIKSVKVRRRVLELARAVASES